MNIIQQNRMPQGITDMADLTIHEASLFVGAAIKKLTDLNPHWTEEIRDLMDLYITLRRELPEVDGKHAGHYAANEAIKYGTVTHYTSYAKGAAGF